MMNRLITALCLTAVLGASGTVSAMAHDACADLCKKCSDMCSKNLSAFQKKGGKYADTTLLNLLKDCIKICDTNSDFKGRSSKNGTLVDKACADICHKCAKSCEALNDPNLKDCIALCNQCAESCEKSSK